tara:strand:+ start:55 stop:1011 length:957 start_codon:yes stop_codon:yes gene_type:complete
MIETTGANPSALSSSNVQQRLTRRANLLASIRHYFDQQKLLEVETPQLSNFPVTDPQLENLQVENPRLNHQATRQPWLYLTTSPEYQMKQLLSLGSGSIYQICKSFRHETPSPKHSIEFTMLEWYRVDFDMIDLINDVTGLLKKTVSEPIMAEGIEILSYREAFLRHLLIDPFTLSREQLEDFARKKVDCHFTNQDKDIWLDLLMSHCIEPLLGQQRPCFLIDYPASQAALARIEIDAQGNAIAKRFELYIKGIELANGYHELADYDQHIRRFEQDNQRRRALGLSTRAVDQPFLEAIKLGLPNCAGVALGVDRLLLL